MDNKIEQLKEFGVNSFQEKMFKLATSNKELMSMVHSNMEPYERLMAYYRCAIMEVETKFRVLNEEYSLQHDRNPIENIKSRLKNADSLIEKLNRKGYPVTVESIEKNIYDVAGVRVVCTFLEDIYLLADCLLEQDDIKLIEKKDYIENPKESGYRSLHLIVEVPIFLEHEKRPMKVEVQLRTISMNFWASLEHQLQYKKDISEEDSIMIKEELKSLAEVNASLDERMQKLRRHLDGDKQN